MQRIAGVALVAFLAIPVAAAPTRIEDCENVKGADAYNYCLASFGPKRRSGGAASRNSNRASHRVQSVALPGAVHRNSAGRITMTFEISHHGRLPAR